MSPCHGCSRCVDGRSCVWLSGHVGGCSCRLCSHLDLCRIFSLAGRLITRLTRFSADPFAEADEDTGETKQSQNYIHIRIQRTFYTPLPRCRRRHATTITYHLIGAYD